MGEYRVYLIDYGGEREGEEGEGREGKEMGREIERESRERDGEIQRETEP